MVYIFSNIHHFKNDSAYYRALMDSGFNKGDTFVFLNTSEPFFHGLDCFCMFGKCVFMHRTKYMDDSSHGHWGKKRVDDFKRAHVNFSRYYSESFTVGDSGRIYKNGDMIFKVEVPEYPRGCRPTTGYIVAKYFENTVGISNIVLVNFLASNDNSTKKANGHAWGFEEKALKKFNHLNIMPDEQYESFVYGENINLHRWDGMVATCAHNNPELVDALIKSVVKNSPSIKKIVVFDNSPKIPFVLSREYGINVEVIDNTKGRILNGNMYSKLGGSVNHTCAIQWIIDNYRRDFVLLDSDTIVKKDLSEIADTRYAAVGKLHRNRFTFITRLAPFCLYINSPLIIDNGIKFFDADFMAGISKGIEGQFDTGGAFLKNIRESCLEFLEIDDSEYIFHMGHASWKSGNDVESFLETYKNWYE